MTEDPTDEAQTKESPVPAVVRRMPLTQPARYSFDNDQLALMKRTIARGADDNAFLLFLELVGRYKIDPFAGQVYLAKMPGKDGEPPSYKTIIARDGLLAIADRHADYGGIEGDVIYAQDTISRTADGFQHTYEPVAAQERMKQPIIGAWARVYRQGRQPTFFLAKFASYKRANKPWSNYPDAMILKCFDPETEVLTDRGFERLSMLSGRVLQVTDTGELEPVDAEPFAQPYDGTLICADGRDLNFAVTPDHRMVTTSGIVTADDLFKAARTRAQHDIPKTITGRTEEAVIADEAIMLAAAYIADGTDQSNSPNRIGIEVSRQKKVTALRALGIEVAEYGRRKGDSPAAISRAPERRIPVTQQEKIKLTYHRGLVEPLVGVGKQIKIDALLRLSQRQARLFVDTWLAFDGHRQRIFISRPEHVAAFEVAAVQAGYSVSPRRERTNDLSDKPNYNLWVSDRSTVPVVRSNSGFYAKQTLYRRSYEGLVWCVTVPSGEIIVRRKGFSHRCGQCAESMALRKAFSITGLIPEDEVGARYDERLGGVVEADQLVDQEPDWGPDETLAKQLQVAFAEANRVRPGAFLPQKIRLALAGADTLKRREILQTVVDFALKNGGTIPIDGDAVDEGADAA